MESSHRGLRRRVAALALEVEVSRVWDTGPSEWVRGRKLAALGLLFSGLAGHRCFIVLSLLQESHQTHLLNKKTPEGGVKILQGYCVFLLGKARNTHYFLNIQEGDSLFVPSSWILKEIVRNIWKTQKECWKCVTLKYYNIQQSNTRDCCEMYYTDGWFYWKICVTTIYIQEGDI